MSDTGGPLSVSRDGDVAVLTLSAPAKRNAMTESLMHDYAAAIGELQGDASVRCVVLTANGPAFSAGGDLSMLQAQLSRPADQNRRHMVRFYQAYLSALHLDVPTICAVQGDAIGAGLSFTLSYDIRIASESARLGVTYLNIGLHPGMGTIHLLPVTVGDGLASELILTGKLISGAEAARIGLVNAAVPAERVREVAMDLARGIAAKPTAAMRMAKRALAHRKLSGLEAALDYEATAQMSSFASTEMREALAKISSQMKSSRDRPRR